MDVSNMIALLALLFSAYVWWSGRKGLADERKDRQKEDRRRDQELELRLRQVEGEEQERLRERRAELICRQSGRGSENQDVDYYDVRLHNAGRATAHDVSAWITTEDGQAVGNPQRLGTIARDEESPPFKLLISQQDSRRRSRPLSIRAAWADGAGEHEENLEALVPFGG